MRSGLLALAIAGCAGATSPAPWTPPSQVHRSVVYLSTECSGALIGPRTVLTAAHCVEDEPPYMVRIDAGPREEIAAISCTVHPAAYRTPRGCGEGLEEVERSHDLAILILAEAPRGAVPLPVALAPPFLGDPDLVGRQVRLVGWDRQPRVVGPLSRRVGWNRLSAYESGLLTTLPLPSEDFATRIGNSGGPLLLRIGEHEEIIGVLHGGVVIDPSRSVYASAFEPENAQWIVQSAESGFGEDLGVHDPEHRFGAVDRVPSGK